MAFNKKTITGSRPQLKEKVVQIYELFFMGEDISKDNDNFWDEFFLLKPKTSFIEAEIEKLTIEKLFTLKNNMQVLFLRCIETFEQHHQLRVIFSLKTLTSIISSLYKKCRLDPIFDFTPIIVNPKDTDIIFENLLKKCNLMLCEPECVVVKDLCLQLLLTIVTGTDNLSDNRIICHLMSNSVFESLIEILSNNIYRTYHGCDSILLLTLLMSVESDKQTNPYIVKLSLLDKEDVLNGYSQIIRWSLEEICCQYRSEEISHQSNNTWLNAFTNAVSSMLFVPNTNVEQNIEIPKEIRSISGILISLYKAVHYNRHFMTTLTHCHISNGYEMHPSIKQQTQATAVANLDTIPSTVNQFSNLLVTFFQYCSVVMQDTKTEVNANNSLLCFVILCTMTDDQFANSLMHDVNLQFKVELYRPPNRRYMFMPDKSAKPLAAALLDLMIEFMLGHMMKKLPFDQYMICTTIIHRIICYQKQNSIRLSYNWKDLWSSLIMLLKFLITYEHQLSQEINIFDLGIQVVNIFNLFITYGDMLLPSPNSYDELYYEIIRMHTVFDNIYVLCSSIIFTVALKAK
ncbi:armadillo-like helical domain-containing protein 3 isoform X2 [Daktulosphaira vitifoliae]|uniref:armadillo-like helical domain-containing protein 3 isoform X2 n=1 Tax=Daktulosphaira vitifoliae TaxID=58002 RepID=UPI0021A99567|nr:armadillo-like helical domain-containing protein 3 isoform X2 [Daktulosphaira vitifoliae]